MKKLFYGYHFPMTMYTETYQQGGFTQLSLDFSSRCNYRCDWCFNKHLLNSPEPDILTSAERELLLRQASEMGAKTLVVPGTGEPTLDPYFEETIQMASQLGFITVVYSNLTGNLDEQRLVFMRDHNVSIGIKLDSFSGEHFEQRYHTSARKYEEFKRNLDLALEVYQGTSVVGPDGTAHRLIANMVLTKENAPELETIVAFCKEANLPLFVRPVKPVIWATEERKLWKQIGNESGLLTPEQDLLDLAKRHNTLFSPSSTPENHCAIFSFGLTVKSNGDVQLCPDHHDSRGFFNVRRNGLKEIMDAIRPQRTIRSGYCVMMEGVDLNTPPK